MADSVRFAKSPSPRELKREKSALASTGTGVPVSFAASSVQRPSPESETRPPNLASVGSSCSAWAVRSSSHDATTLPRRQTSVTSARSSCVLVALGVAERRRLGVDLVVGAADVGVVEDVQALGVGGHDPVLDAVVHHLHEVAGAGRPAVQVAALGGARIAGAARRALGGLDAGRERGEDGVEARDGLVVAADHQAVAAIEPEHAARGADVEVVELPVPSARSARRMSSW